MRLRSARLAFFLLSLTLAACNADGTSTALPPAEREAAGSLDSAGTNNAVQHQSVQNAVGAGQ